MEEAGILGSIRQKYFDPGPAPILALELLMAQKASELGYETLLFPFLTLLLGGFTALFMVFYEWFGQTISRKVNFTWKLTK